MQIIQNLFSGILIQPFSDFSGNQFSRSIYNHIRCFFLIDFMLHQKKVLAFYYAFFGCHPRSSTSIYKKIFRVKCNQNARTTTADKASNHNKGVLIHKIRRDFSLLVYDNHITDTKWTATEILRSMLFQPFPNHLWCVRCKQLGKIRLLIILYDHLKMMFRQILI